jgi:hypothetical protein
MTNVPLREAANDGNVGSVSIDDWIGGRTIFSLGTNAGADVLPFQAWRNFKEAFAPELVRRAISESPVPVRKCLDPFGGSGTTALACQFLGVRPTTIEVNPYLADLIEAKLVAYDISALARDFATLVRVANKKRLSAAKFFSAAPPTFVEPGVDSRWIFDSAIAARLASYVASLETIESVTNRRLLRVLLGGVLIDSSNVIVSGKGRRYRRGWEDRYRTAADLDEAFCSAVENAVGDILRYANRTEPGYSVLRGDARSLLKKVKRVDIAIFSPPYPNSFDYTDVYNVELWGLRYLCRAEDNTRLRLGTLESHVQIKRCFSAPPAESTLLKKTLRALCAKRDDLWNPGIPDMVGGYFADMRHTIKMIADRLPTNGQIWMVVGDSRYAGVSIPVADILAQLAGSVRCRLITKEPFRSMRTSAQQGGSASLSETLLVLGRR